MRDFAPDFIENSTEPFQHVGSYYVLGGANVSRNRLSHSGLFVHGHCSERGRLCFQTFERTIKHQPDAYRLERRPPGRIGKRLRLYQRTGWTEAFDKVHRHFCRWRRSSRIVRGVGVLRVYFGRDDSEWTAQENRSP